MSRSIRIEAAAAAIEGTYATDATPDATASDAIQGAERLWTQINPEFAFPNSRENVVNNSILPAAPSPRKGRFVSFELPWSLRGAGSAYAAAADIEADPLLQACGLSATVVTTGGSESVTYAPADTGHASATVYIWADGNVYKIVGCRGNLRWPVTAGEHGILRFAMSGLLLTDPAAEAVPAASYGAEVPPAAVGMSLTLDSWTPAFQTCEFDQGANVQRMDDGNASDGIEGFEITEMNPRYTIQARTGLLASDYNAYQVAQAASQGTVDQTLGDTRYNRAKIDIDDAYLMNIGHVDYNSTTAWNLEYELTGFSLIFD